MLLSKFFHIIPTPEAFASIADDINDFSFNLSSGIFCSALVVAITYTGAYRIEKTKIIGLTTHYCGNYILELSNLIPLLVNSNSDGEITCCFRDVIDVVKHNKCVHSVISGLLVLHNERLLAIDGFYPFFRTNKKNLETHYLLCLLAKINGAIQYCDTAYNLENNLIYKREASDFDYTDKKLIEQLKIVLQIDNDDYQRLLSIYKAVINRSKPVSVYNTDWEKKCL